MNRFKAVGIQFSALVLAGLIVSPAARAEYYGGSYNAGAVSKDIGRVEGILNPGAQALGQSAKGAGGDKQSLADSIKAGVEKAEKAITLNQKELKWRKDNRALSDKRDKLKIANSLPALIDFNISKRREEQDNQFKQLFSQLNAQPQSTMNPADLDVSGLEAQCSDGVDFTQLRSLHNDMQSTPMRYMREQAQLLIQEKDKAAKENRLKTLQKLASEFDKLANTEDDERRAQQSVLDQDNSLEARLDRLKADGARLKGEIGDLRRALVKGIFTDMIPKLSQIEENDQRLTQLGNNVADSFEGFRKAMYDSAIANAQRLRRNCEKLVEDLGRDNPLAPGTMFNAAYQWVVAHHQGDADFYANRTFLSGVNQISQNLRCTNVVPQVDALFGSNLQNAIAQLRSVRDPMTLLNGAMSTLQAIGSAGAQVGASVKPLMNDCQYAAQNAKKVKKFIQGLQQNVQAQASQDPGRSRLQGGRSATGRQGGAGGAATHRAGAIR